MIEDIDKINKDKDKRKQSDETIAKQRTNNRQRSRNTFAGNIICDKNSIIDYTLRIDNKVNGFINITTEMGIITTTKNKNTKQECKTINTKIIQIEIRMLLKTLIQTIIIKMIILITIVLKIILLQQ